MPVYTIETPSGQKLDIEAANEAAAFSGAQQWHSNNAAPSGADTAADVAKSLDAGVASGTANLLGTPGWLINQGARGIGAASNFVSDTLGVPRYQRPAPGGAPTLDRIKAALDYIPTPESISEEIQKRYYGGAKPYSPQTTAGNYVHSIGEMLPGVAGGPGSLAMKAAQAMGAGVGAEGLGDYFKGTALEPYARLVGGISGGLGTVVGSKAVEGIRNFNAGKSTGADIARTIGGEDIAPGAVKRVAQNVADEELTSPQVRARVAQLGPEARLLDMGHQLEGRADFMAQSPGAAQNTVYRPIADRVNGGASDRLNAVLDQHMGPARDVVDLQNKVAAISDQYVKPAYHGLEQRYPVVNDQRLQELAQRPAIADAMDRAQGVAANYGEKISGAQPSIRYWDYVKKSLDQRINGMMRSGQDDLSSAQKADLGGLIKAKSDLVEHLDNVTGGEYAQARKLATTKPAMEEALDFGRSIFGNKLLPEQIKEHFSGLSLAEQEMVRIGARREIERVAASSANDGRKLRNFLSTNNNSQKLETLLGANAAERIGNQLLAEDQFQGVANKIANSRTATRLAGMNDTNAPAFNKNPTILGAAAALPRMGINYALEHGMSNTRQDISRVLTAQGDQIHPVVEALLKYNDKRAANAASPMSQQSRALVRALLSGSGG